MESMYRVDEIKYKIDTVIQLSLLKNLENKEESDLILEIQTKLYDEFGVE